MHEKDELLATGQNLDQLTYYQLLSIRPDCDLEELRKAFQRFALRYHPDQFIDQDESTRELATKIYQRGVEAYTVLREPNTAKAYAEAHRQGAKRLSPMQRAGFRSPLPRSKPPNAPSPPVDPDAFWSKMQTDKGKRIAKRVERLLKNRRFQEAYQQLGILEQVEPGNRHVVRKSEWLSRYLKRGRP